MECLAAFWDWSVKGLRLRHIETAKKGNKLTGKGEERERIGGMGRKMREGAEFRGKE